MPVACSQCSVPAGFGFAVWALGSVGCAVSPRFWVLILCRVVMGAGEASIITLGNPFIDDVAPPAQKTLWFGILNLVSILSSMRALQRSLAACSAKLSSLITSAEICLYRPCMKITRDAVVLS